MSATRVRDLVALGVLFGVLGYFLTRAWYLRLPALTWPPGVALAVVAALEIAMAARVRAVVGHDPDARPMPAVTVARWIAVGRASAVAGAVVAGLGGGFCVYVGAQLSTVTAARSDLVAGAVLTGSALALTVAGVVLERSGIVPRPPDGAARERPR